MMKKYLRHDDRIILAFGEVTGHCHEVVLAETGEAPTLEQAQFFELDGVRELIVLEPCVLRHQEHGPIALDPTRQEQWRQGDVFGLPKGPGVWEIRQQREWAGPEQWRAVAD